MVSVHARTGWAMTVPNKKESRTKALAWTRLRSPTCHFKRIQLLAELLAQLLVWALLAWLLPAWLAWCRTCMNPTPS